jgi:hypothetical protein
VYTLGTIFGIALLVWIAYDLGIRQRRKKE